MDAFAGLAVREWALGGPRKHMGLVGPWWVMQVAGVLKNKVATDMVLMYFHFSPQVIPYIRTS